MTTKTTREAWEIAQTMIPDYEKNETASCRAGYSIYTSSSDPRAWIADLTSRLEVNTADGKTVNIWIAHDTNTENDLEVITEEITREGLEGQRRIAATKAAMSFHTEALYTPEVMIRVTLSVMGPDLAASPAEADLWRGLREAPADKCLVMEAIETYCRDHGIIWGTISDPSIQYVQHSQYGLGHFVISAFVGASVGQEGSFMGTCAGLLIDSHDEHATRS